MRIVITGSNGQLGADLTVQARRLGEVHALSRSECDLTEPAMIRQVLRDAEPDVIINAAAYTQVERAESEPQLAEQINAAAPGIMAEEADRLGAVLVHFSTDYVFDGDKTTPYQPDDETNPLSVYGRTKLAGEDAILGTDAEALIIRTSWLYSLRRRNFVMAILDQARAGRPLRVVTDQIGCPNWSRTIASNTIEMLTAGVAGEQGMHDLQGRSGVYHLSCTGRATWHDVATHAIDLAGIDLEHEIILVTSEEFGSKVTRPAFSVLDTSRTVQAFGVKLCDWETAMRDAFASEYAAPTPAAAGRLEGGSSS